MRKFPLTSFPTRAIVGSENLRGSFYIRAENGRTAEERVLLEKARGAFLSESGGSAAVSRSMPIFSRTLGLSGECDAD